MPRFAANLNWLFTEHPFLERFGAARAAGFEAVEFPSPYAHPAEAIGERLDAHGLRSILVNLPMGDKSKGDFGIACRPGRQSEFREGVARAIEYARVLRCGRVNCIAGVAPPGEDREMLRALFIENLRFARRSLEGAGVDLVVEPLNDKDTPHFLLTRQRDAAGLLRETGGGIGLQCDLYHTAMMGDDPAKILEELRPIIRHIQFADAPGRGEPGTGRVDLPPLFALIDRLGYDGWVSAEYRPSRRTEETLAWMSSYRTMGPRGH
jgi:hydroxypyruvate isomerase